jgi:ribosomal protein L7/L12
MDQLEQARFARLAQAIGRLERKTDFILKELKLEYTDDPDADVPPELVEVHALLKQGKRLQAIQAYRKLTGAGVDEAATAVEELELGLKKQ